MELIHTCYRITEPDRSVAFYEALGFEERARMPIRDEATNIFMGLPGDADRLELTHNHETPAGGYELGTGTAISPSPSTTSTRRSSVSPVRASSRSDRRTRCARAVPGSASSGIRTATGSN